MTGLTALKSALPVLAAPGRAAVLFHLFFSPEKTGAPVSNLDFFHRLDPKLNARRRLREWLILLLRTLLLLSLLLALARPVLVRPRPEGDVAVVLLD